MTPEGGEFLAKAASLVPSGQAIVEIGVFKGKSLAYMANSNSESPIYGIDPWDLAGGRTRAAHVKDPNNLLESLLVIERYPNVKLIQGFGAEVGKTWKGEKVGLLHIDGKHKFEAVMEDFYGWHGKLARKAVVVFDDYTHPKYPGVAQAARKIATDLRASVGYEAERFGVIYL